MRGLFTNLLFAGSFKHLNSFFFAKAITKAANTQKAQTVTPLSNFAMGGTFYPYRYSKR